MNKNKLIGKVAIKAGKFLWEAGKMAATTAIEEGRNNENVRRQREAQNKTDQFRADAATYTDVRLSSIATDSSADEKKREIAMQELERRAKNGGPFSDVAVDAVKAHRGE